MKLIHLLLGVATMLPFAQSAQARGHHYRYVAHHGARGSAYAARQDGHRHLARYGRSAQEAYAYAAPGEYRSAQTEYRGAYGGRPAAWCGWEMRQLVSGDPGPAYNLARNWARWGRSGPVGVGAVVVWSHHVGKIVGQEGGQWIIESGNDGHRLRTRPRSIAGAIAIRWG
jgi:hypothetical protein